MLTFSLRQRYELGFKRSGWGVLVNGRDDLGCGFLSRDGRPDLSPGWLDARSDRD